MLSCVVAFCCVFFYVFRGYSLTLVDLNCTADQQGSCVLLHCCCVFFPRAMGRRPHARGMGGFRSPQAGNFWVPYLCGMGSHGHLLPLPLSKMGMGPLAFYLGWEWDGKLECYAMMGPNGNPQKSRWDGMGLLCHRGDGGTPPGNVGFNMGSSMGQHRERQSGNLRGSR